MSITPTTEPVKKLRGLNASHLKSRLVDIGVDALARGDWLMVAAITNLVQGRWAHD
jgi:hypothetical protein